MYLSPLSPVSPACPEPLFVGRGSDGISEPVNVDQEGKEEVDVLVDAEWELELELEFDVDGLLGGAGREEVNGSSYKGESRGETRAR